MHGIIRTAAAVPKLKVADCIYNTEEILKTIKNAEMEKVQIICFPQLSITGYSCEDLFFQRPLLKAAENSLSEILEKTRKIDMVLALGLPIFLENAVFNCAVVAHKGKILGVIPKTQNANHEELCEKRWFASALTAVSSEIKICNQVAPIDKNIIFKCEKMPELSIGVEIGGNLWNPIPQSSLLAISGATLILNLASNNEIAAKHEYRKNAILHKAASAACAYIYASSGIGESTQNTVFGGYGMICEKGRSLSETERFVNDGQLIISDIDLEMLTGDRMKNTSFSAEFINKDDFKKVYFDMTEKEFPTLKRKINPCPFIPEDNHVKNQRCSDIFNIQVTALAKRFEHTKAQSLVIGISGGLDSTLALLVCVKACDFLGLQRKTVIGITMPGFGTTDRTYNNAVSLMKALGITIKEISIKEACIQHFKDIGHDVNNHNVTYENAQARERTQILMDIANMENGLVVGTGDLSELALGWATYNGDHMSMYGVNSGVPKTLVKVLTEYVANSQLLDKSCKDILFDVIDTPVSPELLPPNEKGEINQKTEDIVGPYELHDFFLYYAVRFGFSPSKILFLAKNAFEYVYSEKTILQWLKNFYARFFNNQFKRSCLPDGPKVGTVSLSPKTDWHMASDAKASVWLKEIEELEESLNK